MPPFVRADSEWRHVFYYDIRMLGGCYGPKDIVPAPYVTLL
jgi:hypothetical protein